MSAVENQAHSAALKRILGVEPLTYFWCYGSMPAQQSAAHSAQEAQPQTHPGAENILGVGSATLDRAFQEVFGMKRHDLR